MPEPRSDVFWRTSGSGGRARRRGRAGKQTANHHGDVLASDPVGQPLMDLCVWELKNGYNGSTLHDVIDRPAKGARQVWERWIFGALEACCMANAACWAVVHKRDRREPVIACHPLLIDRLMGDVWPPSLDIDVPHPDGTSSQVIAMPLTRFFEAADPCKIKGAG